MSFTERTSTGIIVYSRFTTISLRHNRSGWYKILKVRIHATKQLPRTGISRNHRTEHTEQNKELFHYKINNYDTIESESVQNVPS